jgi:hypothetical protein
MRLQTAKSIKKPETAGRMLQKQIPRLPEQKQQRKHILAPLNQIRKINPLKRKQVEHQKRMQQITRAGKEIHRN